MRHVRVVALALSLAVVVAGWAPAIGQSAQRQTFRTGVDVVDVEVSVLDRDRNPVRGLTAADFTIRVDGKPATISAFTPVDLPARAADAGAPRWAGTVAPDVVTNDVSREGRLVVIVFDQTLQSTIQPIARQIATAAVDQLGPGDLAAVYHLSGGTPQGFTTDRSRLLDAIKRPFSNTVDGEWWISGTPDSLLSVSSMVNAGARGECSGGVCTLIALTRIAESLRDMPRRKMLMFIGAGLNIRTPGERAPMRDDAGSEIPAERDKLFRALDVANLTIHSLDPTALETLSPNAGWADRKLGRISADRTAPTNANLKRQLDLSTLPARTGGRAVANANDPGALVPAIFKESESYYAMAFTPEDRSVDGRYHEIDVRVNRKDVSVYARKGYYATAPSTQVALSMRGAPPALAEAATGPWPRADLPLRVAAAAFAVPGEARPVAAITIAVARTATTRGDTLAGRVDALVGAFDRNGRSANYEYKALEISPGEPADRFEYEIMSRLPLEPGRYQLRAAATDGVMRQTGSVAAWIDVPDTANAPLSASGAVLSAAPSPLAAPPSTFKDLLPVVPTARRQFANGDRVSVFVRIYEGGRDAVRPVKVSARIEDRTGAPVFSETSSIGSERFDAKRSADYLRELPLATLAPGDYLLTIDIAEAAHSERRTIPFSVR